MARIVYVYSEQALTPRAVEVIREIKKELGYEDVKFKDVMDARDFPIGGKILCFGNNKPGGIWNGVEFIHTYSIAQIMTKANAVTALSAAFRLYFGEKHEVPADIKPGFRYDGQLATPLDRLGWDYSKPTVVDIETDGNLGVTHTPEDVNIISIALYQEGKNPLVFVAGWGDGDHSPPLLKTAYYKRELEKFEYLITHNGKFDFRVLNRYLGTNLKNSFDTMLAHHVLNHAASEHGLKALARRYLGAPDWEGDIKQYTKKGGHYEYIPTDKLVEYNGWDVYWTYQLFKLFQPQIEQDDESIKAFMFEMAAAEMLLKVERNGIPFDVEAAKRLASEQTYIMDNAKQHLATVTFDPNFNPNSPQQVKRYLNGVWKLGVTSTSEAVIEEIKGSTEHPGLRKFCELLIKYRKASKIKGTYAEGWMKKARKGRVHPTFLVHGTSTGRLSSTQPNAQNMPRDKAIRKIVSVNGTAD